jgi:hypothetical protein
MEVNNAADLLKDEILREYFMPDIEPEKEEEQAFYRKAWENAEL